MPDLYGWIQERITATERSVRDQESALRQIHLGADNVARVVFRRCAADRNLLEVHRPRGVGWSSEDRAWGGDPNVCEGCGQEGICQDWVTAHANDCPVLLAVAEGYGLTEEILAALERPEWVPRRPDGPSVLGVAVSEVWAEALRASLTAELVPAEVLAAETSPQEKAMRILGPELRTIPLYQSAGEEGTS